MGLQITNVFTERSIFFFFSLDCQFETSNSVFGIEFQLTEKNEPIASLEYVKGKLKHYCIMSNFQFTSDLLDIIFFFSCHYFTNNTVCNTTHDSFRDWLISLTTTTNNYQLWRYPLNWRWIVVGVRFFLFFLLFFFSHSPSFERSFSLSNINDLFIKNERILCTKP